MIKSNETYENCKFKTENSGGQTIVEASFYGCVFLDSMFQATSFVDCEFKECSFINSNLSLANLINTRVLDTVFDGTKLVGINWGNAAPVIKAEYINCLMDNCAFSGMNLSKVKFKSCSLKEAAFSNCKLQKVRMENCDCSGCLFHKSDLTQADFSSARNYFISAETNILQGAKFSLPEAVSLLANLNIELVDL